MAEIPEFWKYTVNWDDKKQMHGAQFHMVSGSEVENFNKGWEWGVGAGEIEVKAMN